MAEKFNIQLRSRKTSIILLLLVSFASVGALLFTPALPAIATYFAISAGKAQLTMTTYLIGYAIGQLPYGPLANRFGRKPTLYGGIILAIIGSLLCAFSAYFHCFTLLVVARFLQASGACVGFKIAFTIIAESYDQIEGIKKISQLLISFAVVPGLAVAIGGWLTHWFNWESCFYFFALFGVMLLFFLRSLPETASYLDVKALKWTSIFDSYAVKFKNKRLVISALMMGCISSVIFGFGAQAPFIGINLIGLSPEIFGSYNLIPLVGKIIGAVLAAKFAGRFSLLPGIFYNILISLFFTVVMVIAFGMKDITAATLFFPMFFIYLSEAIIFSNISSFGLAHAKNKSNGSAVLNFINLSTAVIAVLCLQSIDPEAALPMPISFAFFSCMILLLWYFLFRIEKRKMSS